MGRFGRRIARVVSPGRGAVLIGRVEVGCRLVRGARRGPRVSPADLRRAYIRAHRGVSPRQAAGGRLAGRERRGHPGECGLSRAQGSGASERVRLCAFALRGGCGPPEPIAFWRKTLNSPDLLGKSRSRTGPIGSENGWQYAKRLAVRLAVAPHGLAFGPAATSPTVRPQHGQFQQLQLVGPAGVPTARSNWSSAPPPTRGGGPWT